MQYTDLVTEYFNNTKHFGKLNDTDVLYGKSKGALLDNFVEFWVKLDGAKITNAKYQALGCPILIACSEFTIERILGSDMNNLQDFNYQELVKDLDIPHYKVHCAIQVEQAWQVVLSKYLASK